MQYGITGADLGGGSRSTIGDKSPHFNQSGGSIQTSSNLIPRHFLVHEELAVHSELTTVT